MDRFEIRCTESQTRKALELGAHIENARVIDTIEGRSIRIPEDTGDFYICPTAEQMIGWLEEQGLCIEPYRTACGYLCTISKVPTGTQIYSQKYEGDDVDSGQFTTRSKATLAAIDTALDYIKKHHED